MRMTLQNDAATEAEEGGAAGSEWTAAVRGKLRGALKSKELTQDGFARKHDIGTSWLNKFLRGEIDNPRVNSLDRLEKAIELELRS
jgi:predicted transcriptional regulator